MTSLPRAGGLSEPSASCATPTGTSLIGRERSGPTRSRRGSARERSSVSPVPTRAPSSTTSRNSSARERCASPSGRRCSAREASTGLDGDAHRHRKGMLQSLTTPERVAQLTRIASSDSDEAARAWTARERVVLYDEARDVIARAVCRWAGVPVDVGEMARRALALLFEGVIPTGPKHVQARLARGRLERWCGQLIRATRDGRLKPGKDSALEVIGAHRDQDPAFSCRRSPRSSC